MALWSSKMDILTLQCFVLSILLFPYIATLSLSSIVYLIPLLFTLIYKVCDVHMKNANLFFHYDIFILLNSVPVLIEQTEQKKDSRLIVLQIFIIGLSMMEQLVLEQHASLLYESYIFLSLPMLMYSLYIPLDIHLGGSHNLAITILIISLKLAYYAHVLNYKKENGFYNTFLIELGGGDSVMKKNIGYHIINYQLKLAIYSIYLPIFLLPDVPVQIVVISVGIIIQSFFAYIVYNDLKNLCSKDYITEEEHQNLKNNIGIDIEEKI